MTAPDVPWTLDGPGERYLCPLQLDGGPCPWYLDVPAPEVDLPDLRTPPADGVYRLTVTEVPMAAIEARILEHLRGDHAPAEVWARLLEYLGR